MRTFLQYTGFLITCFFTLCCTSYATQNHDEYNAFALEIEKSINTDKGLFFNEHFDKVSFADAVVGGIDAPNEFPSGLVKNLHTNFTIGTEISNSLGSIGNYKFLGIKNIEDQVHAIFRMVNPQGLNYHIMKLEKDDEKNIQIKNVYAYTTGEWLTETIRKDYIITIKAMTGNTPGGLTPTELAIAENYKKHRDIWAIMSDGKYHIAYDSLKALPALLQQEKSILYMKLRSAASFSAAEFEKVMAEYNKFHPNAWELPLLSYDGYILLKNNEKAQQQVNKLEKNILPDVYLNVLRATSMHEVGLYNEADSTIRNVLKTEKTLAPVYIHYLRMRADLHNYAGAVAVLNDIQKNTTANIKDVIAGIQNQGFLQSEDFIKWRNQQQQNSK